MSSGGGDLLGVGLLPRPGAPPLPHCRPWCCRHPQEHRPGENQAEHRRLQAGDDGRAGQGAAGDEFKADVFKLREKHPEFPF